MFCVDRRVIIIMDYYFNVKNTWKSCKLGT
jgi:hypothetical protein